MRAGSRAERYVARLMKRRGFAILARNYRCKSGEIDLVGRQGDLVVIVEVRYRRSEARGRAQDTVTREKQVRIVRAAHDYLRRHPALKNCRIRFDVAGVSRQGLFLTCEWVENAFQADVLQGNRSW